MHKIERRLEWTDSATGWKSRHPAPTWKLDWTKCICLIGLISTMLPLCAADQTVLVANELRLIPTAPTSPELTLEQGRALVQAVLGGPHPQSSRAYLLHAVRYQPGRLAPEEQHWYVYDRDFEGPAFSLKNPGRSAYFRDKRVFGNSQLGLVYLHILQGVQRTRAMEVATAATAAMGPEAVPADLSPQQMADQITGTLEEIRGLDPNDAELPQLSAAPKSSSTWILVRRRLTILKLAFTGSASGIEFVTPNGKTLTALGGQLVESSAANLSALAYKIDITQRKPQPQEDLEMILDFALKAEATTRKIPITLETMSFAAGAVFDTSHLPSDLEVRAYFTADDKESDIGKETFLNEKKYWYDFSLAVPVNTSDDLRYSSTGGGFTVNKIEKTNVWALVNLGLPRDLKKTHVQYVPVFGYGIPITGQPLKHHMFVATVGLNKANVFAGLRLDRKQFIHDFSKPIAGDNTFQVWRTHLTYGINFPVSTIVDALKKKAK